MVSNKISYQNCPGKRSCTIRLLTTINHTSIDVVSGPVEKLMRKWVTELSTCYKQVLINMVVSHTFPCFIITQHYYEQLHSKNIIKFPNSISSKKKMSEICFGSCSITSFSLPLLTVFSCMPSFIIIKYMFWSTAEHSLVVSIEGLIFGSYRIIFFWGCWVFGFVFFS